MIKRVSFCTYLKWRRYEESHPPILRTLIITRPKQPLTKAITLEAGRVNDVVGNATNIARSSESCPLPMLLCQG